MEEGDDLTSRISLLIVDDHEVVRIGLKALFDSYEHLEVVGQAANAQEAIDKALTLKPDVVIMDVRMPGISGIEACREIRSQDPGIKVIMLTSYADDEAVLASLLAGAEGYVLKKVWSGDLIKAIEKVYRGEKLMDRQEVEQLKNRLKQSAPPELAELTEQEKKVLALIAEAKTNKEIAQCLFISEKTVRNYVSSIFRKLNLTNRSQAVVLAQRLNFKRD
ncbi:MAG: response regulator transcription factor [Clostridia bacterium]|nr:response regulator transcription factor [Clostridia bacterium]